MPSFIDTNNHFDYDKHEGSGLILSRPLRAPIGVYMNVRWNDLVIVKLCNVKWAAWIMNQVPKFLFSICLPEIGNTMRTYLRFNKRNQKWIWYDMKWYMIYDMIWYDMMIRYDDMIYDMVWYMIWCDIWYMIWYMIWYDIWYDMIYHMIWWYDMIYYKINFSFEMTTICPTPRP